MIKRSPQSSESRSRIRIVEDDNLIRSFYKLLFQKHENEFVCRLEKTGVEALLHMKTAKSDAVILDGDISGISDHFLALKNGAYEYLLKSFDFRV